jgi:hypothetical protein
VSNVMLSGADEKTVAGAIDIYENIFSVDTSKKIIKIFEDASESSLCPLSYSGALIGGGDPGGAVRSNVTMNIEEHWDSDNNPCSCGINDVVVFIREKLSLFVRHYSEKYRIDIAFDEGLQLLKYGPGRQYKPHVDYGPGAEHRVLSGLIYLNPGDYVGGGTYFTNFDYTVEPENPSLALFPSNYAYEHAARPVFDGYKYAIVTWFGPPWTQVNRW